jgi:hypothetical protein
MQFQDSFLIPYSQYITMDFISHGDIQACIEQQTPII